MKKSILLSIMILCGFFTFSQNKCPITGDTKGETNAKEHHRTTDSYKNRSKIPVKYTKISFQDMKNLKVTNNMTWDSSVYIDAYILEIKDGGKESCNCHSNIYKDTHIYIVENKIDHINDDVVKKMQSDAIIVEATPRFRESLGTTSELKKYVGKHVRIYGYLFRDDEHKTNSTIDKGNGLLWRHTVWEIHPITKIELL